MYLTNETYVDKAEQAIKALSEKKNFRTGKPEPMVTTSKIRNLLSMAVDIYNEILLLKEDKLDSDICGRIDYLRIRFVYEEGRDKKVKEFAEEANLLAALKEVNGSKKNYILFYRYMEALVAFHKFYGGRD